MMATGIPTATNIVPNAFQQQHYPYRGGVQYNPYSPTHSGNATPTNVSPTQIPQHMSSHSRQLRPPKCPMYVPAALRPTERPQRSSPPKGSEYSSPVESTSTSFARRGTADSFGSTYSEIQRISSDEGSAIGPVTGPPSRNHWKVRYFSFVSFCPWVWLLLPLHPSVIRLPGLVVLLQPRRGGVDGTNAL